MCGPPPVGAIFNAYSAAPLGAVIYTPPSAGKMPRLPRRLFRLLLAVHRSRLRGSVLEFALAQMLDRRIDRIRDWLDKERGPSDSHVWARRGHLHHIAAKKVSGAQKRWQGYPAMSAMMQQADVQRHYLAHSMQQYGIADPYSLLNMAPPPMSRSG